MENALNILVERLVEAGGSADTAANQRRERCWGKRGGQILGRVRA